MLAVVSLLPVLALSLLLVRVGSIALHMTGLSQDIAAFQALSAFSGAGFTTGEAENVVATPLRRKIVALLIRLGSLGVVTSISSLVLSFVNTRTALSSRLLVLLAGVVVLIMLSRSAAFNRFITRWIQRALQKHTTLDLQDYAHLLHLREDYQITELAVTSDSWLASRPLEELQLAAEGIVTLGVVRQDGHYVGAPTATLRLEPGDRILVYGHRQHLQELSQRSASDQQAHRQAKQDHTLQQAEHARQGD